MVNYTEHVQNLNRQAMYAVIHGGLDRALRRESTEILSALPFDGMAIGGSVGKSQLDLLELLQFLQPLLPPSRPRHLLGPYVGAWTGPQAYACFR